MLLIVHDLNMLCAGDSTKLSLKDKRNENRGVGSCKNQNAF